MTQSFITTPLANDRVLVTGFDNKSVGHEVILQANEYNLLKVQNAEVAAGDAFDKAVNDFFAPITAAVDALEQASKVVQDPAFFIVTQEAEQGHTPRREVLHYLQQDTVILRMIESGNTSRLIWIGDNIEVLALPAPVTTGAFEPANDLAPGEPEIVFDEG